MTAWPNIQSLIPSLLEITKQAGGEILSHYAQGEDVTRSIKPDKSPVTGADLAADAIIVEALTRLTPDIPVVSEESFTGTLAIDPARPFWLVDPLDGTKEFLARTGEFTVNIGLIVDRSPVLGVIGIPVADELYWGAVGHGAWRECHGETAEIATRVPPPEGLTVAMSRFRGDPAQMNEFLKPYKVAHRYRRGSSWKFCDIAGGIADLYASLNGISEWDTAAGHALVVAAGGSVRNVTGEALLYGKADIRQPPFVVAGRSGA